VSPVRYELGFMSQKTVILHSRRRENLKSCKGIISLSTTNRYSVFREVRTTDLTILELYLNLPYVFLAWGLIN
jgi:hypothetical protein